jgi:hypothetical protein
MVNTDKKCLGFIRVNLCPSVALMLFLDPNRTHPDSATSGVRSLDPAGMSACATRIH